ncbi:HAT protein [Hirschfeldia incana]|nr:HAT protein [Hirschfeldia incana]
MDNSDLASDPDTIKNQNSDGSTDDTEYEFEGEDDETDGHHDAIPNWYQINPITIRKEVLKIYEAQKIKAKKFLSDFQGKLTLSYEWMLCGSARDYTCLTAHFIDDNFNVRSWILGFTTGASIPIDDIYVYHFRKAVQDFEVQDKVSTILLPNRAGFEGKNVDAIRKCMDSSVNLPVFVVYCCADLFRLMVNDLYNEFSLFLYEDVRMLVGWGRFSSTNWNVRLYHLQQAVDMQNEDAFSKDEIYDDYDKPSDEEWVKIRTFCRLAGVIYKVAREIFEVGYSTSNVYFHLLAELKVMLREEVDSGGGGDGDYFLRNGEKMLKMFDKYWNDMFLVLATASVLDPRFKMKYVDFYCSKKVESDDGSKAAAVLDYLRKVYARYAANDIFHKPICPVATIDYEDEEEEDDEGYGDDIEKKKTDAYEDFVLFKEYLKFEGGCSRELQESELDSYLKEPVMEWNKDFKALEWWKEESQKYPILSRVARDILSIPISRASSYDAYVSEIREPPEYVRSMDAIAANAMVCGRSWLSLIPI